MKVKHRKVREVDFEETDERFGENVIVYVEKDDGGLYTVQASTGRVTLTAEQWSFVADVLSQVISDAIPTVTIKPKGK